VTYWPASTGVPANTYVQSIFAAPVSSQALPTAGVVNASALTGTSSPIGKTGAFIPSATLSGWLVSGSGQSLTQGISVSSGVILSESTVLTQSGNGVVSPTNDASLMGEP
jgi:hypothetical protein